MLVICHPVVTVRPSLYYAELCLGLGVYDDARLLLLVVSKETEACCLHENPASQPRGMGERMVIHCGEQLLLAHLDHLSHSLRWEGVGGLEGACCYLI